MYGNIFYTDVGTFFNYFSVLLLFFFFIVLRICFSCFLFVSIHCINLTFFFISLNVKNTIDQMTECISAQILVQNALKKINGIKNRSHNFLFEEVCYELEQGLLLCSPVSMEKYRNTTKFVSVSCNSPIGVSLLEIVQDFQEKQPNDNVNMTERIYSLIRIPDAFANALLKAGCDKNYFNYSLFIEKFCDIVIFLLIQNPRILVEAIENECFVFSESKLSVATKIIIQVISKFGYLNIFLSRLKLVLIERCPSKYLTKQLVVILVALFELTSKYYFSKTNSISSRGPQHWLELVFLLLKLVESYPEQTTWVEAFFFQSLDYVNWETISERKHYDCFKDAFPKSFFSSICLRYAPSRRILKFIYDDFLFKFQEKEQNWENSLLELTSVWGQKKWSNQSLIESDSSLTSAIIYILLNFEKKSKIINTDMMSHILDGVSLRLGSTRHVQFRENGMTVAAAFATTSVYVDSQTLQQNEDFTRLYSKWRNEEEEVDELHPTHEETLQVRNCLLFNSEDRFPLIPDHGFFFFSLLNDSPVKSCGKPPSIGNEFSFGMVTREADNFDRNVEVLTSLKQCFNVLIGVGKPANAQMTDIQYAVESSLRGLNNLFEKSQQNERIRESMKIELGPLCPTLLQTLISISIHAPEAKLKELLLVRFSILVNIIVFTPKISLYTLSNLLYSGSLGILQRTEIARAIGDAAVLLANEVHIGKEKVEVNKKRIYPPMHCTEKVEQKFVGKKTRKWGFAAHNQSSGAQLFSNSLGKEADSFVQALLVRHDRDHFKFFQDHDPYTPSEVLRSLMKIFQSLSTVRHIAPAVCGKNIYFFLSVLSMHDDNSVKRLGWTLFEEVMRCWCGAPSRFYCLGDSIVINRVSDTGKFLLTKEWLDVLEAGRYISAKLVERSDPLQHISVDVISSLQNLVLYQEDLAFFSAANSSRITPL